MGRPRKTNEQVVNEIMNPDQVVETVELTEDNVGNVEVELPVFDKIALGIVKDPKTGYSFVIEVPINDLMQVGTPKIIGEAMEMDIARERFRIEAGNRIL